MTFYYTRWLELPLATRISLALVFGIAKIRPTHVSDNRVADDGYNVKDIENALSLENIQKYLETKETDMVILWQDLIDKVEGRVGTIAPTALIIDEAEQEEMNKEYEARTGKTAPRAEAPKKRGRPAKNAKV